ncbi:MAG: NAD+ synthase, partial [Ilumatobacteraceae bacterium]
MLRIALAQMNPVVGDLGGNVDRALRVYRDAVELGADLVVFGELAICGYPPEDLLLKPRFVSDVDRALSCFADGVGAVPAVIGTVSGSAGVLYNSAAVVCSGAVVGRYDKRDLPNYAVFDEVRYFRPGQAPLELFVVAGVRVGLSVCEDMWGTVGPHAELVTGGAQLIVSINGSPYHHDKDTEREEMMAARASELGCPVVYVNQVGGQDELVFDGGSFAVDADGSLIARSPLFTEDLRLVDVDVDPAPEPATLPVIAVSETAIDQMEPTGTPIAEAMEGDAELYSALVLGTRDYCRKNGFSDVVIGLSGGIDSTLVACVAVDALGPEHVHGVAMPSRYSSDHSLSDAHLLATNLGIDIRTISIEPAFSAFESMLATSFAGREPGLTQENLQSRCRGQILMALSNEFGWMVLTTGNKSELAVGYFTIYGDSVGGYAVIKDLLKMRVYDLCRYVNSRDGRETVPVNVIEKAPSAELRPDQRDDQSLPPYEVLDQILAGYVEQDLTTEDLIDSGFDAETACYSATLADGAQLELPLGCVVLPAGCSGLVGRSRAAREPTR